MRILVKNNIVYCIIEKSIEFDVNIKSQSFTKIDGKYHTNLIESEVEIYDYLEDNLPKNYCNLCFTYNEADPNNMTIIEDRELDVLHVSKSKLLEGNNKLYEKIKYNNYYDEYNNKYDTSIQFSHYLQSLNLSDVSNNPSMYTYENEEYTINELLHMQTIKNQFYSICEQKKNELDMVIEVDNTSVSILEMFGEIEDYWPKENEKLNLDGTISNLNFIPNKFRLGAIVDKNTIDADGIDNVEVTITLYYDDVIYTAADGITWYVPILGIDDNQIDMVEIVLINGQSVINWSIDKKGIYSFRLDLVRPKPKASIPENIEIIAK